MRLRCLYLQDHLASILDTKELHVSTTNYNKASARLDAMYDERIETACHLELVGSMKHQSITARYPFGLNNPWIDPSNNLRGKAKENTSRKS